MLFLPIGIPLVVMVPALSNHVDTKRFVSHRFGFADFIPARDVFARAGETGALKVVFSRDSS